MRLLLSTAVIVVLQKASQGCMNASHMSRPGGSRKLEPPVTRDRPNTLCLVTTETGRALQRDDENWLPMVKSKDEARDTFKPKAYGMGGWKFGLRCGHRPTSEGWQQGRRARSTPSRVQALCQLQGGRAARVPLAIACRILSDFSVACLERFRATRESSVGA